MTLFTTAVLATTTILLVLWMTTHLLVIRRAALPPGWTVFQRRSLDIMLFLGLVAGVLFLSADASFDAWSRTAIGGGTLLAIAAASVFLALFLVDRYLRREDLVEADGFDPFDVEA